MSFNSASYASKEKITPVHYKIISTDEVNRWFNYILSSCNLDARQHLSMKWGLAYQLYNTKPQQPLVSALPWAKQVWNYSSSLWKYRNGVQHGDTAEEERARDLATIHQQVRHEFTLYTKDPFIVASQFRYLFHKVDLPQRLQMGRDSLQCWLRSVREAKRHLENFCASLVRISRHFTKLNSAVNRRTNSNSPGSASPQSNKQHEESPADDQRKAPNTAAPLSKSLTIHEVDHG
jgi:hypothetical protein